MKVETLILGAGMTGLSAGYTSGLPVYEAQDYPGGICSSYYIRPGDKTRHQSSPSDGEAYRFEIGGGHWIFGGDPTIVDFIRRMTPVGSYPRMSSVFFKKDNLYVPFPIQNHLGYLPRDLAVQCLSEIASGPQAPQTTMQEWLLQNFGTTLTTLFFGPFHQLYTAGLWKEIAPQDAYKSPVNLSHAIRGAFTKTPPVGYNTKFLYPKEGLDSLSQRIASEVNLHYGKVVTHIDTAKREVIFRDGSGTGYERIFRRFLYPP